MILRYEERDEVQYNTTITEWHEKCGTEGQVENDIKCGVWQEDQTS